MQTGNILSYLVLAIWPCVVWQFYRRHPPERALVLSLIVSYLILPPAIAFDLPLVSDLDKDVLPPLTALLFLLFVRREPLRLLPEGRLGRVLLLLFVLSPFATVLTNTDPLVFRFAEPLPGMRLYDSFATVATEGLHVLPMLLARQHLSEPEAIRDLLRALVIGALAYLLPMLVEARLSPQLNHWLYGYHQHDFLQTIRFGGYRPMVFLPHGLWLAIFVALALLSAGLLFREGPAEARPARLLALLLLGFGLVLAKSFGPSAYAMIGLPLVLLAPPRLLALVAGGAAAVVLLYPMLRGLHLVPIWDVLQLVQGVNAERAWSLEYRLINEEQLLARAAERPWFGWGGYGRNFLHDPDTGRVMTVADGHWVIRIGQFGWLGYLSGFGLLCLPLLLLLREALAKGAVLPPAGAALALLLAVNLLDLLPNATLVPLTWAMAGGLLGHAEKLRAARRLRQRAREVERVCARGLRSAI